MNEIERTFRQAYGEAVATLVRVFGDITLAEDAVQDAFVTAIDRWTRDGIPPNPAGWIVTTARNRAIDQLRRSARGRQLEEQASMHEDRAGGPLMDVEIENESVPDDRLRLIFTCCHPALSVENQVALTLRLLGGLSVADVARSFLVTEPAMAKRLVRAKYKIKAAQIPYRIPPTAELPTRLKSVLLVVYLIYNHGLDDAGPDSTRPEAIRLARTLVELMPTEPEAAGLLALLLLSEARAQARIVDGNVVLLRDQDRKRWDRAMIGEGHSIVRACIRGGRPGPYQIQAAIQGVHDAVDSYEQTDWRQVLILYDQLSSFTPTPVVALNRAIALGEVEGPHAQLEALDDVAVELDGYHLLHAARGAALRRLGRQREARHAFQRAAKLAATKSDRRFLTLRAHEAPIPT